MAVSKLKITGIAAQKPSNPSHLAIAENQSKIKQHKSSRISAIRLHKGLGLIKSLQFGLGKEMHQRLHLENLSRLQQKQLAEYAAAVSIQSIFRGWDVRKRNQAVAETLSNNNLIAVDSFGDKEDQMIESAQNMDQDVTEGMHLQKLQNTAAKTIQNAWKGHYCHTLYKSYKNIIKLHLNTNPAQLLKLINPRESILIDNSVSIRIRFRLGGESQPLMYYKLYVGGNVVDLNAFSPRNYHALNGFADRNDGRDVKYSITKLNRDVDKKSGWYSKFQVNSWRPVMDTEALSPEKYSKKCIKYHHLKSIRQKVTEKEKQQKRLLWKKKGIALLDWKLEEMGESLVDWTKSLNYDEYQLDWLKLAYAATDITYINTQHK